MTTARRGVADGVAIFLFLVSFLQAADSQMVAPLLPELGARLGGAAAADRLVPAYAVGAAILPFAVALAYRRAARRLVGPALGVHALAAAAFAFGGAEVAAVARAASGAASGVLSVATLAFAAEADDAATRARRIAALTAGYMTALVGGVPLGALAAERKSVAAAFVGVAAVGALLGALAFALRLAPVAPAEPKAAPEARTPLLTLIRGRSPAWSLVAVLTMSAALGAPVSRLGVRLYEDAGFSPSERGLVFLWAGVAPLIAMPLGALLLRRLGPAACAALGSAAFAVPILALAQPFALAFAGAAATLFVAVLLETLRKSGLQALIVSAAPPADRPRFLALRGCVAQAGLAGGAAAAAALHRRDGLGFGA
ncbi:MAG TPA: MFS transporter, partial [Planctomycetota bacterium]|nr:MFS transporter [Planctomycetota bacterium]